jgi:hypothetical protein
MNENTKGKIADLIEKISNLKRFYFNIMVVFTFFTSDLAKLYHITYYNSYISNKIFKKKYE